MVLEIIAQSALAVVAIILLVRLHGLRSFSKMSSFDFALTIATGSLIAVIIASGDAPWPGLVGLAAPFAARFVISKGCFLSDVSAELPEGVPWGRVERRG